MLCLSLGPEVLIKLLQSHTRTDPSGLKMNAPDLSWLLFGPDVEASERPDTTQNSSILQRPK